MSAENYQYFRQRGFASWGDAVTNKKGLEK